jgi:hypothetical protein
MEDGSFEAEYTAIKPGILGKEAEPLTSNTSSNKPVLTTDTIIRTNRNQIISSNATTTHLRG